MQFIKKIIALGERLVNLQDLYSEYDLLNLTNEDYKKLKKNNDFPGDIKQNVYLYDNLNIIMTEDEAANIINSKALAGQCTIKWYKFDYTESLSKDYNGLIN